MDFGDYVQALRRRWLLIAFFCVAGMGLALLTVSSAAKIYTAEVRLFVSAPGDSSSDISGALSGSTFTQDRVKSYADIVTTPEVTQPVAHELHLPLTPSQLSAELSASAPMDEVVLNIVVRDRSPARAQSIANAVGLRMTTVVNLLERPTSGGPSPVKLSIVQQASLPTAPTTPRPKLDLALGFIVGLVLGIGAAVALEFFDNSVNTAKEIDEVAELATLGSIAYDSEAQKRPLVVYENPHSARAEAFRQLRTNLQFVDVDHPPRSIVITSAVPGEGKSTTTTNLALTFALTGLRVLLIEGDLRRPKVSQYVGLSNDLPGLTDVLVGRKMVDDVIIESHIGAGLSVLPSGASPPNPSELLASNNMRILLSELVERFDMILIDAPPLLPVTDAAVLGAIADGTVILVRAGKTTGEQLKAAVEFMKSVDVRVFGAVLNMVPARGFGSTSYGYGGYGGYSGYGSGTSSANLGHKRRRPRALYRRSGNKLGQSRE